MKKLTSIVMMFALLWTAAPAWADDEAAPADPGKKISELPYTQPRSPLLAGSLSLIPGLGQVYNEQYGTGAIYFVATTGLYMAGLYYAGVLRDETNPHLSYESIVLFALAGGLHLLSIFDATLEAVRVNETLEKWSVMVGPEGRSFNVAYRWRF